MSEATPPPWLVSAKAIRQCDPTALAELSGAFSEAGVLVVRAACAPAVCAACLDAVNQRKASGSAVYTPIHEPALREEQLLEPLGAVRRALLAVAASCGAVLSQRVGPDAELCELSAITSEPGAAPQRQHADTTLEPWVLEDGSDASDTSDVSDSSEEAEDRSNGGADEQASAGRRAARRRGTRDRRAADMYFEAVAPMVTAFVALRDISVAMGPTRVWPGTHAAAWHCRLLNLDAAATSEALRLRRSFDCDVRQGDCVLMDSRLWHCGGANQSDARRTLLVASFLSRDGHPPYGSTYSLLEHLTGQLTLGGLMREAEAEAEADVGAAAGVGAKRGACEERDSPVKRVHLVSNEV